MQKEKEMMEIKGKENGDRKKRRRRKYMFACREEERKAKTSLIIYGWMQKEKMYDLLSFLQS